MNNLITLPHTSVLFGRGEEERCGECIKLCNGSRVLIHYGRQHVTDPDLLDKIRHSLEESGLEYFELGLVQKNSRLELIYQGIELCNEHNIDFILAVGGGSVVNSAKAIASGVLYKGGIHRMFENPQEICEVLPIGVIVTVPGSGDELSDEVTVSEKFKEESFVHIYHMKNELLCPRFVICNPDIVTSFPKHLGISFANVLIRIAESFFTNHLCFEVSDSVCLALSNTMTQMLYRLTQDPADFDAKANFMWGAVLAYTSYGLDRQEDLAIEKIVRALISVYDCSHGQAASLIFPCWLEVVMNKDPMKAAKFASGLLGIPFDFKHPDRTAIEGIKAVRALFRELGLPSSYEDLGGSGADINKILDALKLGDHETIGSYVKFNRTKCEALLSLVLTASAEFYLS